MKRSDMIWVSSIGLVSFLSCNKPPSSSYTKSDTPAPASSDSVLYMLTVDSISIPVKLQEIGDFPVYSKDAPFQFTTPGNAVNYKDTKYLHFLNRQMIEGKQRDRILRKLKEADIESIRYTPGEQAVQDYGQKAVHGIIFIETRSKK